MTLTVIATARWQIHWAGCNNPGGGIDGQVTKCKLDNGLVFYVRENLRRDHFATSSNARIGMKRGEKGNAREALDLCCPEEWFEKLAALVAELDPRNRPVGRHARFTAKWAERALKGGK